MKWNLEYLFKTREDFLNSVEELDTYIERLYKYKDHLADEKEFVNYLLLSDEFEKKLERAYQYAHLKSDLNKKDVEATNDLQKVMLVLNKTSQALAFESPEILKIGKEKVLSFIDNNPSISQHRFGMEKLFHLDEHVLDARSERLLSIFGMISGFPRDLYSSIAVSDNNIREVKLSNNRVKKVSQGNWRSLIAEETNPRDRKKIFEAIFNYYEEHKNTFAKVYELSLKLDLANIKSRGYNSILESYLFKNNIPLSVYTTLIQVASKNNKSVKKYFKLRKRLLNLKHHYSYDRFLQLGYSDKKYDYATAKEMFFNSISHLPSHFIDKAHEVLKDGFVDVYESDGKRSGAYSSSQTDLHPYILLNYSNTLDDVFTVAHEAGHSIHSMYAAESQPARLQHYTIFVAEIASTFNEHLLLDSLLKSNELSNDEKIILLQKQIDEIISTFYRQSLFAHYELEVSKLIENDMPINHQVLSDIMIKLYKQYYGMDISKEKVKQYVWAYIPHLYYTPFYVYQYATSFAASFALYHKVKEGTEEDFERYINLLRSGGSKYPILQTKEAGIDLTDKNTFLAVTKRLDDLVSQLENYINEGEK